LYHGTPVKSVPIILKKGLDKMNRTHVHLSKDIQTATIVGARRGDHTILKIDTVNMLKDGYIFYKSENDVFLIEHVPAKYISL